MKRGILRITALALIGLFFVSCNEANGPTAVDEGPAFKKVARGTEGGNWVIPRDWVDSWNNFSLILMNGRFTRDGTITHWEVFTGVSASDDGTEPVRLVIYRLTSSGPCWPLDSGAGSQCQWAIVDKSPVETPTLGFNMFELPTPIDVQADDFVGLVNSSVMFSRIVQGGEPKFSTVCYGAGYDGGSPPPNYDPESNMVCTGDQRFYSVHAQGPDVTICHKLGTPAEKTKVIPVAALAGHMEHGDYIRSCPAQ